MQHSVKTNSLSECRQLCLLSNTQLLKSDSKIKGHQISLEICPLTITLLFLILERSFWASTFHHSMLTLVCLCPLTPILHPTVPSWLDAKANIRLYFWKIKAGISHLLCLVLAWFVSSKDLQPLYRKTCFCSWFPKGKLNGSHSLYDIEFHQLQRIVH